MNKKTKWFAAAAVTLLSASVLAACGSSSSSSSSATSKYTYVYTSDPETLDYTISNKSTTGEVVANLEDGLLENDEYGNLVPSLAEDWKVSADGLTYTYTIRDDAKWYTVDGEEYGDITAEDFVTGLKHAADGKSEALYLVQGSIVGLDDYVSGKTSDFSTVGVKAVDEKTVQYTLKQAESYWNSKMTMGIMFPVNAEFLASKGEDYGSVSPDSILYSGPYLLSALTSKSQMVFAKNENYWDADNVSIEEVALTYFDGSDPDALINGFADGTYTGARVYPTSANYSSIKKEFGDNIYYGPQNGTIYYAALNLNRTTYGHTSKTSDEQKTSTQKALRNKDFRQALNFAIDRNAYTSQNVGEDASSGVIRNMLVPPTFVSAGEKSFGDLVTANLASYGSEWSDVNLSDAQDGLYNVDKAKEQLAAAKSTLQADGVQFPIHIDMPVLQNSEIQVQSAQSMKQTIEASLGTDNVVIDLQMLDEDTYMNVTYYAEAAAQNDFDLSTATGWGPDYNDPSTYLDIFKYSDGASLHQIGLDPSETASDVAKEVGLVEYEELVKSANAITTDINARYEAYAKAAAYLADQSYVLPTYTRGGTPTVSKAKPFSGSFAWAGIKGSESFKYIDLQEDTVTKKEYDAAYKEWQEAKAKSNAEYQESLADHVE
ncbi:peptide ABC transporter substrate-binding protein [Streptococcus caprae]|uniref:Peptide ABC transporter substrate-binding protein n=1 Tax=Streptococcus caprae TaxID=1640501 RepID=A0ABV8CWI5_9STRE